MTGFWWLFTALGHWVQGGDITIFAYCCALLDALVHVHFHHLGGRYQELVCYPRRFLGQNRKEMLRFAVADYNDMRQD